MQKPPGGDAPEEQPSKLAPAMRSPDKRIVALLLSDRVDLLDWVTILPTMS